MKPGAGPAHDHTGMGHGHKPTPSPYHAGVGHGGGGRPRTDKGSTACAHGGSGRLRTPAQLALQSYLQSSPAPSCRPSPRSQPPRSQWPPPMLVTDRREDREQDGPAMASRERAGRQRERAGRLRGGVRGEGEHAWLVGGGGHTCTNTCTNTCTMVPQAAWRGGSRVLAEAEPERTESLVLIGQAYDALEAAVKTAHLLAAIDGRAVKTAHPLAAIDGRAATGKVANASCEPLANASCETLADQGTLQA